MEEVKISNLLIGIIKNHEFVNKNSNEKEVKIQCKYQCENIIKDH